MKILNWFKSLFSTTSKESVVTDTTKDEGVNFYDTDGNVYPIMTSRSGRKYINRVSKNNIPYRFYIDK